MLNFISQRISLKDIHYRNCGLVTNQPGNTIDRMLKQAAFFAQLR